MPVDVSGWRTHGLVSTLTAGRKSYFCKCGGSQYCAGLLALTADRPRRRRVPDAVRRAETLVLLERHERREVAAAARRRAKYLGGPA